MKDYTEKLDSFGQDFKENPVKACGSCKFCSVFNMDNDIIMEASFELIVESLLQLTYKISRKLSQGRNT